MTIDEAIAKHRKIAETQKTLYDACILKECNKHFLRKAEEHEQLAEWLEELKAIKDGSIPIIHGKAELELHDKELYNKTIDDAKSVILQTLDNEILVDTLHLRLEQLKEQYGRD